MNRKVWMAGFLALMLLAAGCQRVDTATQPIITTQSVTVPATTVPSVPGTVPTEPTAAPTEPTTAPTEPTAAPTEPTTVPTEPTAAPTEPTTAPTEPTAAPTEPATVPTQPTKPQREKAPDIVVYDRYGNPAKLSDYYGRPIILNFWATWCPPCRTEMPGFDEMYRLYGDRVQFLMVNLTAGDYGVEYVQSVIDAEGFQFPVLFDLYGTAADAYGVEYIPYTFFIDREGGLIEAVNQKLDAPFLKQMIAQMLAE